MNEQEKEIKHQLDEFTISLLETGHRLDPELLLFLQENPKKTSGDWIHRPGREKGPWFYKDPNAPLVVECGLLYTNKKTKNVYEVLYLAKHSETQEPVVVYKNRNKGRNTPNEVWVRPLSLFQEKFEEFFE